MTVDLYSFVRQHRGAEFFGPTMLVESFEAAEYNPANPGVPQSSGRAICVWADGSGLCRHAFKTTDLSVVAPSAELRMALAKYCRGDLLGPSPDDLPDYGPADEDTAMAAAWAFGALNQRPGG